MADDNGGINSQFLLNTHLEAGVPYILVVAHRTAAAPRPYLVSASGPSDVQFTPIDPMSFTNTSKYND